MFDRFVAINIVVSEFGMQTEDGNVDSAANFQFEKQLPEALPRLLVGHTAVSYTQLDGYKRQVARRRFASRKRPPFVAMARSKHQMEK